MKRWIKLSIILCIVVAGILFFPIRKTYTISGDGAVLNLDKEKVGDCTMSVEIQELKSLAACYRRSFSFTVNNTTVSAFESCNSMHVDQDGGVNFVSQTYFSDQSFHSCGLIYPSDLSYASLQWKDNLYFIDTGANMAYSDIPFSRAGD